MPRPRRCGIAQCAPQCLCPRELPRLLVGRTACQLRPVRSPERTTVCCLCSRRTCAGGTALFGKRACSAGSALPGRTALCQSFETGAGQSLEKSGGLKMPRSTKPQISFADWELLQQGIVLEPLLQNISDFLDDHEELVEPVRRDLQRGLKHPRTRRGDVNTQEGRLQ